MTSRWPGGWPGSTGAGLRHRGRDRLAGPWVRNTEPARVISITDPPNLRSLAVMRRLGMVFDHEAEIEDMGVVFQAVVYAITVSSGAAAPQLAGTAHDDGAARPWAIKYRSSVEPAH